MARYRISLCGAIGALFYGLLPSSATAAPMALTWGIDKALTPASVCLYYNSTSCFSIGTMSAGGVFAPNLSSPGLTGAFTTLYALPSTGIGLANLGTVESDVSPLRSYCYIGDGSSHALSTVTSCANLNTTGYTLGQWQALVPAATALTDEVDWAAIQSALNAGLMNIVIPKGTAVLNSKLSKSNASVHIRGAGSKLTLLKFPNASAGAAGIDISQTGHSAGTLISGLSLITDVNQTTNSAIKIAYTDAQGLDSMLTISDVEISGGTTNTFYWNRGIECTGCAQAKVSNVLIRGKDESNPSGGISSSNMLHGIKIAGQSSGMLFDDVNVTFSQFGYYGSGKSEQSRFVASTMLAVNTGWLADDFTGSGDTSAGSLTTVQITSSHCASYANGVVVKGWRYLQVTNTLFFKRTESSLAYKAISLQEGTYPGPVTFGSRSGQISGNVFEGVAATSAGESIGIVQAGISGFNQIIGNRFNNFDYVADFNSITNESTFIGNNAASMDAAGAWFKNPSVAALAENNIPINAGGTDTGIITFAALDATPNVGGYISNLFYTNNASATTITNLLNGKIGDVFTIVASDVNTTIQHNSNIKLIDALDYKMYQLGRTITLTKETASVWREISRSTFISTALLGNTTAPTISSGFGTSPTVPVNNGTWEFQINVGTGGTANTGVIGLPTARTGWHCSADDLTTQSATVFLTKQTASSTTTATIKNFDAAGAVAAWAASDVLWIRCGAL